MATCKGRQSECLYAFPSCSWGGVYGILSLAVPNCCLLFRAPSLLACTLNLSGHHSPFSAFRYYFYCERLLVFPPSLASTNFFDISLVSGSSSSYFLVHPLRFLIRLQCAASVPSARSWEVLQLRLIFSSKCSVLRADTRMHLYHHPFDLNSQKVRLALEEKGVDYTSHHVNPITGKNLDASFFEMNPSGRLPVFQNGSHILYETIDIIQYIERIAKVSSGAEGISVSGREVIEWMGKIQDWDPKFFTLSHVPDKYRIYGSKFIRRVVIARMSESPELAGAYHRKLREAYQTEEKLKDPDVLRRSKEHLVMLLDEVERQLSETPYLAGQEFTMADVVFIPVLTRLVLLDLEHEYIADRPNTAEYWLLVQQRPSYKKVIGKYFDGWRKHKMLLKTWCCVRIRSLLKKY